VMIWPWQDSFRREVEEIEEVFTPLVLKCKELGRAMRIGTNHGSLSARILSFYGDTPRGMVESAFEFTEICRSVLTMIMMMIMIMMVMRGRGKVPLWFLCSWWG
jgi:4-hydroxy-3-methylbut-2-en-1-yl diphosphate synthase IspG/GcpE